MANNFSTRNAGVRRLMQEAKENSEPTELYAAKPIDDNLFEWHFSVRGPAETEFDGGVYHGRIIFPTEYPMKPPNIILLTPNGRFEVNKKICLSISGYHPETWLPSWSVRTALLALIGFMPTNGGGAIGALSYPPEERKKLATRSLQWTCKECGACMKDALRPLSDEGRRAEDEARSLIKEPTAAQTTQGDTVPVPEDTVAVAEEEEITNTTTDQQAAPAETAESTVGAHAEEGDARENTVVQRGQLREERASTVTATTVISEETVRVADRASTDDHSLWRTALFVMLFAIFFGTLLLRRYGKEQ